MKIKWPWTANKERINIILHQLELIMQALIDARVANFIMVKNYRKGDKFTYEMPDTIKLENLLERIEQLERNK